MKSLLCILLLLHFSMFSQDKIVNAEVLSDNEIITIAKKLAKIEKSKEI